MPSPEFPNNFLVLLNNYELFFLYFVFYCPVDDMNYTIAKSQVLVIASNGLTAGHLLFFVALSFVLDYGSLFNLRFEKNPRLCIIVLDTLVTLQ